MSEIEEDDLSAEEAAKAAVEAAELAGGISAESDDGPVRCVGYIMADVEGGSGMVVWAFRDSDDPGLWKADILKDVQGEVTAEYVKARVEMDREFRKSRK